MLNRDWLINPWRPKDPAAASRAQRAARARRAWQRELLAPGTTPPVPEEDGDQDLGWYESSRALAQGLSVTEHHAGLDAPALRGHPFIRAA